MYYDSEAGEFVIGSLVKVNTFPSDENHGKIGLIISGADPFRLESLSQTIIENLPMMGFCLQQRMLIVSEKVIGFMRRVS